ncbi:MAG TPA: peptidylprolyl isomerase [Thermoanaerobaculia bacterium]
MLKVFRDNLKSLAWILWIIIAVFVLAIAADFGSSVRGRATDATAATVGSDKVSVAEVQRAHKNLTNMYRQVYGDQFPPELEKQLYMQALKQAVNQKILLAEARHLGLTVTDAELRDKILEIPALKDEQGRFVGEQAYAQMLQNAQITVPDFEREMRDELLMKKLTDALSANLYVGEDEVQRAYRDQVERAKIRYVQLPRTRFEPQVQVSPAEVEAYFKAHPQEFRLPEQRDVAYLLVNGAQMAGQAPTDQELRSWYDAHKPEFAQEEQVHARHILVMVNDQRNDAQAQARVQEAKKKLEGGADFATVARQYSDDPGSKDKGGDVGTFGRNRMVKEFEDAAFSAQPHKLVGPVKSSFGYHLIEVLDKRPGGLQPFEAVAPQIRARLSSERTRQLAETRAKDLATRLAANKPANADAVKAVAQPPAVTYAETGRIGALDPVPGLGTTLNTTAFSLKKGEVSQAVQVPQGWAILYVKDVTPAHAPQLAEVEPRVRAAVTGQKLQQIARQKLAEARKEIAQGKTLDQVAASLGVPAQETAEFGGQGTIPGLGYNPELAKAALALPTGQVGGPVSTAQGELLFQVTDHKGWDPKQYATSRDQTRSTLLQQKLSGLEGTLIEQRSRELNVEYNRQFLDQLGIAPSQVG